MSTFSATLNLELSGSDGSLELLVDVTYNVTRYYPAQGPSYASGGQPAEGGEVIDLAVSRLYREHWEYQGRAPRTPEEQAQAIKKRDILECPAWLSEWIIETADEAELYESAMEGELGDD